VGAGGRLQGCDICHKEAAFCTCGSNFSIHKSVAGNRKMIPNYTYTSSIEFINNLAFEYVETYSLQRGEAYEQEQQILQNEYDKLIVRKDKNDNLSVAENERLAMLKKLCGFTQYLVDDNGQLHYSAEKTNTFLLADPEIEILKNILRIDINEIPRFLCAPTYRDGFVFYDGNGNIVSVLNVCLECQYMETKCFNHINGDFETYYLLKKFFIGIGHKVETPEYFVFDDLKAMKDRLKK
jgi:hypothetical protein